ncbi:MAG: ComF family protein [Clostridia bacterium]|nr:ComF family protein [Clostridia bacterium]
MMKLREKAFVEKLLNLMFPTRAVCMGCGSAAGLEQEWLCDDCRKKLAQRWLGAFPERQLDGSAAAYHYGGPSGGVVRNFKYHGVRKLAEPMAKDMLRALDQIQPIGAELVVPVPMHRKRRKQRGYNQSELLAREIAKALNLPCENGLVRMRNTVQQAKLEGDSRRKNLKGAFRAESCVAGKRILLVDDVYTTGETARECARALRDGGAVSVSFLSYAKGD